MECPICLEESRASRGGEVLGRYRAAYRSCRNCQFVWINDPHWLDEAYSEAIAALDTGILVRNRNVTRQLSALFARLLPADATYLDVGAGYGLLVRSMRDLGFDFYWSDEFAAPLLARGFEDSGGGYDAVTAIEVLEHVTDPVRFLGHAVARASTGVAFTTELHTAESRDQAGFPPTDWWYLAPESGQHISFFSHRTLEVIAERLDCYLLSSGALHMLTRERLISDRQFDLTVRKPFVDFWFSIVRVRRRPLTWRDHVALKRGSAPQ
jgi:hypothetical protein